jgi:hypothetical protein
MEMIGKLDRDPVKPPVTGAIEIDDREWRMCRHLACMEHGVALALDGNVDASTPSTRATRNRFFQFDAALGLSVAFAAMRNR